ncbi:TIGR01212 family radical SAM protein [bacterium]|nr:TIGR01212 family radical SAM protein [bacterium]
MKKKFGVKVYKVTIDACFSCPIRENGSGGCIFCDESGSFSQAHSSMLSVGEQLETGIKTLSERFKAEKFISYFQAYTNTYRPVDELERIYKSALGHKDVVGISIGTRPDCVDDDKLRLISDISKDYYTWIEYGLQSSKDETLRLINRGHDFECFVKAYEQTKRYGINVCAHVILGLPNETREDMLQTARQLAKLKVDGVKIHMLCVLEGTRLAKMYEKGEIKLMSEEEYISTVVDFLELLPKETTIHRLAGNGLKRELIEPRWIGKKLDTLNRIDKEFRTRNSFQGFYY